MANATLLTPSGTVQRALTYSEAPPTWNRATKLVPNVARVNLVQPVTKEVSMRNPGTAAVLSFLIPGIGQIYNGTILRGVFWLIITPGLWVGTGGLLGWICHIVSAYTAYQYAQKHPI
jgi:TM2 domain-containing membrane protein YozV